MATNSTIRPALFLMQSVHNTYLCIDEATGQLCQSSHFVASGHVPLVLGLPSLAAQDGVVTPWQLQRGLRFLHDSPVLEPVHPAAAGSSLAAPDDSEFRFYPVLVRHCVASRQVLLQDPFRMLFLSAEPETEDDPLARVGFRRDNAGGWEHFRLHPVQLRVPEVFGLVVGRVSMLLNGSLSIAECASIITAVEPGLDQETWLAICFRAFAFADFIKLLKIIGEMRPQSKLTTSAHFRGALARLFKDKEESTIEKETLNIERYSLLETLVDSLVPASIDIAKLSNHSDLSGRATTNSASDFWLTAALPGLVRWSKDRRWSGGPNNQAVVNTDLDFLQSWNREIPFKPCGWLANFIGRYCTQPVKDICVIATARNEGPFLLEWIAHHQAIGIKDFYIYSNDNEDGSDALLERLSEAGVIHYIKNIVKSDVSPQYKAYKHALSVLPDVLNYRWALVIDIDEYMVIDSERFASINECLSSFTKDDVDVVCFTRAEFGTDGHTKRTPEFVRNRFTRRRWWLPGIKCAFRPNRFLTSHSHFPFSYRKILLEVRHSSGVRHADFFVPDAESAFFEPPNEGGAWVNHYHYKSAEEYLWARSRGSGDWPISHDILSDELIRGFLAFHSTSNLGCPDDRVLRCTPSFDAHYQKLIMLPGVPQIMSEIDRIFEARSAELKEALLGRVALGNSREELIDFLTVLQGADNLPAEG